MSERYRWVVVAALLIISALTIPMAGGVMGFFVPAMHAELAIPMALFGWAISTRQLAFAVAAPWLGRWLDRFGARLMLVVIGSISAVIIYLLGEIRTGWQLIVCLGLLGLIGLQGGGGDLFTGVVISKWFQENRARAMSIVFIGMPLGTFIGAPLTEWLIGAYGWRATWQIFGIVCGGLFVAFALLLRNPPNDSRSAATAAGAANQVGSGTETSHQWTRREAVRSGTFWRLSIAFGILMFTISTVVIFRVPYFIEQGVDPGWVAIGFSVEAIVSATMAIPVGLMLERFRIHLLGAAAFTMPIWMLLLTINADTRWEVLAATMTFGMGAASVIIIQNTIWPAYFGSEHIGAIRGAAMPITLGFAVLGAPVAGIVRDLTGSFVPLWWATFAAMLVAIVLMLCTPAPRRGQASAAEQTVTR